MGRTDTTQTDTRPLKTISLTDPASNTIGTTSILNTYSGVVVTTTTTGVAQTLGTPSNTDAIKRFSVINNDTSTDPITVNGEEIAAGEVKYFIWDGSAWTSESGSVSGVTINAQTGTTYTLVITDQDSLITLTNAAAITLTIPTNASVAFPVGTQIDLSQDGAGVVTVGGASVTINSLASNKKSNGQYVGLTLIKTATDTWNLYGNLTT